MQPAAGPPAYRIEERERRLIMRIVRALRAAGVDSLPQLRAMRRTALLDVPGLGARGYDYLNEALNHDDRRRLTALVGSSNEPSAPGATVRPAAETVLLARSRLPGQRSV